MADSTRLRLYNVLSCYELNVNEIIRVMGMGQSRISRHLKILADSGLLTPRRDGLWVFYSAAEDKEMERFVSALRELMAGEQQGIDDLNRAAEVLRDRLRNTRKFFDSVAETWEDMKKSIFGNLNLNEEILRLIDSCDKAVDVGCGTGDLISELRNRVRRLIGVDSSPRMLERARRRFNGEEGIELRLGEAEHLPVRDGEADLAVMNMVLHHLSRPEEGIREVARILRPGKPFLLIELDKHGQESMRERFGDRWLGFDSGTVAGWLEGAGFALVEERSIELRQGLKLSLYKSVKT